MKFEIKLTRTQYVTAIVEDAEDEEEAINVFFESVWDAYKGDIENETEVTCLDPVLRVVTRTPTESS